MRQVFTADWVLPVDGPPIERGAVAWEDGRLTAVGSLDDVGRATVRYAEAAILPGLVNAHTHLEYSVYAGFGDGLADFSDWITLHIERKARVGWDDHLAIARLGAAECLRSGVTTVGDCSYSGAAAVACADVGLRGVAYLEVFGADPDRALERFTATRERIDGRLSTLVQLGVSPHAPYSTSLDVYSACAELGLPLATHLSESPAEVSYLTEGRGPWQAYRHLLVPPAGATGIRMLERAGLLGPGVLAAHCTVVDADEIDVLASRRTGVAHCARSNAALGCGIAPLNALRQAGVRVGLGTDSPASAPSLDFFEEGRAALLGARARERRADALAADEVLELATLGAARALGLDGEIGSLTPGKRADLTVVSLTGSPFLPWEDPAVAVVLGGSPDRVVTTVVDGEVRYERDQFDWLELQRNARSARCRMLVDGPLRDRL